MIAVFLNRLNRSEVMYLNYPNLFLIGYMHIISISFPFSVYCIISNSLLPHFLAVPVLGAFAKFRKATFNFVMSDRPSEWNNSAPTGRIFIKLYIRAFFEKLSYKNNGYFT